MTDTNTFLAGQTVNFKGYAESTDSPILEAGERVKITAVQDDGSFVVYSDRKDASGNLIGDAVFADEIEATGDEADLPVKTVSKAQAAKDAKAAKAAAKADAPVAAEKPAKTTKAKKDKAAKTVDPTPEVVTEDVDADVDGDVDGDTEVLPGGVTLGEAAYDTGVVAFEDSESVRKVLAESKDAIEAAKSLAKRSQQNDFALGGVLAHISRTGIWKNLTDKDGNPYDGKRGFTQFIKDNLDVDYRKAMYLIGIYTTLRRLGKGEKDLERMGWSKAKEIAAIAKLKDPETRENIGNAMLDENFDTLVEYAATHSREDLVDHIKTNFLNAATDKIAVTKINLRLVGEAGELVKRVIDVAKTRTETGDAASAIELVCGEWELYNADLDLDQAIAALQNKYGVTLAVVTDTAKAEQPEEVEASA